MGQDNSKLVERQNQATKEINAPYKCTGLPSEVVYIVYKVGSNRDGDIFFDLMCVHNDYESAYNCAKENSKFGKYGDLDYEKAYPEMDENYIYYGSQKDFDYMTDGYGFLIEKQDLRS